ncbi:MAG TPA: PspC domain-containing protein [Rubricoccaceae bacterium]|nr:PspC domain-containing protein [Rubricoccaceae bacterium]
MSTRERPRPSSEGSSTSEDDLAAFERLDEITDEDIEAFIEEQETEEEQQEKKEGFWNVQTASGLALITLGVAYLLQRLGFFAMGFDLGGLAAMLPWLAGILIILTGFGVLSWRPNARRRAKARQKARERELARMRARQRAAAAATGGATADRAFKEAARQLETAFRDAGRQMGNAMSREARAQRRGRRLAKSRTNKKIAGVCGGIAEYLGIEPTLVRIAFVLGAIFGNGFTIPLYLILAFVMPNATPEEKADFEARIRVLKD